MSPHLARTSASTKSLPHPELSASLGALERRPQPGAQEPPDPTAAHLPHCRPGVAPCPALRRRTSAGTAPAPKRRTPPPCSLLPRTAHHVRHRRTVQAPVCRAPPAATRTGAGYTTAPSRRPAAGPPAVLAPTSPPRGAPETPRGQKRRLYHFRERLHGAKSREHQLGLPWAPILKETSAGPRREVAPQGAARGPAPRALRPLASDPAA